MEPLYNYGISQEDVLSEFKALEIANSDSVLCIASGGEIPLNLAALQDVTILAVDNSVNQLRLCRIKQVAATVMDSVKAASFLGYMIMPDTERQRIFEQDLRPLLSEDDYLFWKQHSDAVRLGVINSARFEKYIRKVSGIGRSVIGKRNLNLLFDCDSVDEQKLVFDRSINGPLLRSIFKIAFHPKIYKNRGIDPAGLTHSGARDISDFFFRRFRNFCCSTLARKNYYLQYTFFNEVLFTEALPEFLQPDLHATFIKNSPMIKFSLTTFQDALMRAKIGSFNKIHLSNIGDWMSKEAMAGLFSLISDKILPDSRMVMRYIHLNHQIPVFVPELIADYNLGEELVLTDRYPFYSIVPIIRQ